MSDEPSSAYVSELEEQKRQLESRIAELQVEVRVINNLIYRHKARLLADDSNEKVNLKNVDRLFFETLIMDTVAAAKGGLRTGEIYSKLGKVGYSLNYNTLRAYVTKMRDKGLIKKRTPSSYYWVVVSPRLISPAELP